MIVTFTRIVSCGSSVIDCHTVWYEMYIAYYYCCYYKIVLLLLLNIPIACVYYALHTSYLC